MQAGLRLTLIFNSITALFIKCIALIPVTMLLAIFHVIKGKDLFLWSLEVEKCNLTACSGQHGPPNICLQHMLLYLHDSKMAVRTKPEHCRGISSPISSRFVSHTNYVAYLIVYPPTCHRAQCSQCCGVKYNADEAFKANAIWKAGKGEETQLSARHVFFKGCP